MGVNINSDRIRARLNLTATDVDDTKVSMFIQDAAQTVMDETGRTIDFNNCTQQEARIITDLAAVYIMCYLTGGSAAGTSFWTGDLRVELLQRAPNVDILYREVERGIRRLRGTTGMILKTG